MKSNEIKQGDSLGQGAATVRSRKHNRAKQGESIRLSWVLSSSSAGCSSRCPTNPGQAHQAPPSVMSLFGHEIQCLASIIFLTIFLQSKRKQLPGQVCKASFSPESWNAGKEMLMLLSCYCTLRWLLQMPNLRPFPSLGQSQQYKTHGLSAGKGKSLQSLLGRRLHVQVLQAPQGSGPVPITQ